MQLTPPAKHHTGSAVPYVVPTDESRPVPWMSQQHHTVWIFLGTFRQCLYLLQTNNNNSNNKIHGSALVHRSVPKYYHSCLERHFYLLIFYCFKVFIEFVTILLLFYVLVFWPRGMWDLSSPTRDRARTPRIGSRSLNQWTAREVPRMSFLNASISSSIHSKFLRNGAHH